MSIFSELNKASAAVQQMESLSGNAAAYRKIKACQHLSAVLDFLKNGQNLYGHNRILALYLAEIVLRGLYSNAAYVQQYKPVVMELKLWLENLVLEDMLTRRTDYSRKFKVAVVRRGPGYSPSDYELVGGLHPIQATNSSIIEQDIPDYEELKSDEDGNAGPGNQVDITVREVRLGKIVGRVTTEVVEQMMVSDVEN